MSKVTVEWWKKRKSEAPKGLPSTGLEALLKKYEQALETLGKKRTAANVEAAQKALNAVEKGRVTAMNLLSDDKWKDIYSSLSGLAIFIADDKKELAQASEDLAVERKVELSMNEDEAKYERLYAIYEKQEEALKARNGRLEYKTALATLAKLDLLAEACARTPALAKKYLKQKQVLAGKEQELTRLSNAYEAKIRDITALRKKAVEEIKELDMAVTRAKGQLGGILQKIEAAKKNGGDEELVRQKKAAAMIVKGILAADTEVNNKYFASGTTVKDATDVKAAKMVLEDLTTIIKPFSDELFILNRAGKQQLKELQELAKTALS